MQGEAESWSIRKEQEEEVAVCVCGGGGGWGRWGLLPRLSRDSAGNNEKLWQDFKANGRSFPVVMSDSEETLLRDKAGGMHALSHTFLLPTKPWTGCMPLPFCMAQARRSRVAGKKQDRNEEAFVVLPTGTSVQARPPDSNTAPIHLNEDAYTASTQERFLTSALEGAIGHVALHAVPL